MTVARVLLAVCIVVISGGASANTPRKEALARELVTLLKASGGISPFTLIRLIGSGSGGSNKMQEFEQMESKFEVAGQENAIRIYAATLTQPQLEQLVALFKSETGQAFLRAGTALALADQGRLADIVRVSLEGAVQTSKQKRTMADMRSLGTATEAWAIDNNAYPAVNSMDALTAEISPTYIHTVPRDDAWDTPFVYVVSSDKKKYRFISAGPDKKMNPTSRRLTAPLQKSDDIVYDSGEFLQAPEFK